MSRLLVLYVCSLTLRSLVLAALAGVVTLRVRSVAGQHAVWTAFLGCLLLMPLADALLPASMVPARAPEIVLPVQTFVAIPPASAIQPRAAVLPPVSEQPHRDWWQVSAFVWIGVAALLLGRMVMACGAVVRIRRAGRPVSGGLIASQDFGWRSPTLCESGSVRIPLTVGFLKPALILPLGWRAWEAWKLRAVLAHELAHVRRLDWAIAVVSAFARCVFWFNPLSWWLERHLSSLAEQASDEASVQATGDAARYAETLLHFASVAKHGRRWIGGVAMAQYKISSRIERVLRLQRAGAGVLSRAGWIAVCGFAMSTLYVSAAAQSLTRTQMPALSAGEIVRVLRQPLPEPEPAARVVPQVAPRPVQPAQQPSAIGLPAPASPQTPVVPVPVNPDFVGEIRLILAPVDQAGNAVSSQIQVQTPPGNNGFAGPAVWNVRNAPLSPNSWMGGANWKPSDFAMTGVQGRTLSFETRRGGTFSYGCPDCSFLASESGVAALPANAGTGIIFRLSVDGKTVTATCRAVECQVVTRRNTGAASFDDTIRILKDSQSLALPVPQQLQIDPNSPALRCFSVFGNVKADGAPFTPEDCPGGATIVPFSAIFFSVVP